MVIIITGIPSRLVKCLRERGGREKVGRGERERINFYYASRAGCM